MLGGRGSSMSLPRSAWTRRNEQYRLFACEEAIDRHTAVAIERERPLATASDVRPQLPSLALT